ncbi:condensation domain-containing protein, partial [Roseateles flavus]
MTNLLHSELDAKKLELVLRRLRKSQGAPAGQLPEAAASIPTVSRTEPLPLSWPQWRLWFVDQMDPEASKAYHLTAAFQFDGQLDVPALRAALDQIVARHESLRTVFVSIDGEPRQALQAPDVGFTLRERDLSQQAPDQQREGVRAAAAEEMVMPFDLASGPLARGQLLRLAADRHVIVLTQHHIVSDGWSMGVLMKELAEIYAALSEGRAHGLPSLSVQYPDFSVWQRNWLQGDALERQIGFWRSYLKDAPALLELPGDHPRPAVKSHDGGFMPITLSSELTQNLRSLAKRHGVTLFMTLLAAWAALLSRLSGQQDVVIGTPVANRNRVELEPLIGFFANTLALRVHVEPQMTLAGWMEQVKDAVLQAYAHQDLPFEQVVEVLKPVRSLGHTPVFQVMFALDNTPGGEEMRLPGGTLSAIALEQSSAHFDLLLSLNDTGGALEGGITFSHDLFEAGTVQRYAGYLLTLLQGMVDDGQCMVSQLPMLPSQERAQLLGWGVSQREYPREEGLAALFARQVQARAQAV